MKIAFFTDTYHPSLDGVVRSIDQYLPALVRRGHEVRVFAPHSGKLQEDRPEAHYTPSTVFPPYPQYRIPYWLKAAEDEALKWKPDVVHCHAMAAMGLAAREVSRKGKIPLVGTFHTMFPNAMHYLSSSEHVQNLGKYLSWHYLRWYYAPFDVLIAPSTFIKHELAARRIKSVVAPSPVDMGKFCTGKTGIQQAKIYGTKKRKLLCLGRVAKEKNLDYLLDMAKRPDFLRLGAKIFICGEGPYKGVLMQRVEDLGIKERVAFIGRVAEKDLPGIYRAADATILPSTFETQGLVALESLACGTPVAAMGGGAFEDMIKDGQNGMLFGSNPKSAIRALGKLFKHRAKLSMQARKSALEFSIPRCTDRLEKIYAHAIATHLHKKR